MFNFFIIYSKLLTGKLKNLKIEILEYLFSIRPETIIVKILKTRNVRTPERGTSYAAGIDFFVPYEEDFYIVNSTTGEVKKGGKELILLPGESALIPSGIKACLPEGYALVAFNKSGVCTKRSITVGAEVVDEDYMGEIHLHVINSGMHSTQIHPGDKLIQFMLIKQNYLDVETVETEFELWRDKKSDRGEGGFGSTGN